MVDVHRSGYIKTGKVIVLLLLLIWLLTAVGVANGQPSSVFFALTDNLNAKAWARNLWKLDAISGTAQKLLGFDIVTTLTPQTSFPILDATTPLFEGERQIQLTCGAK